MALNMRTSENQLCIFCFKVKRFLWRKWTLFLTRTAPEYKNPTELQLKEIEEELQNNGIQIHDYTIDIKSFEKFKNRIPFPHDYHGGQKDGVFDEKIAEHYIAYDLLDLSNYEKGDFYLDVAACSSPWVHLLREKVSINARAIDLHIEETYKQWDYYEQQDATQTRFADSSVSGASLQCAFEMFQGNDDINFIKELSRLLKKGGKCIISPLYMHTHYCGYSTPDYFSKGHADSEAKEYIRRDCWGIPFSRKYDAMHLKKRVLDEIENLGMSYRLKALRNKDAIGENIYCHFILEITN